MTLSVQVPSATEMPTYDEQQQLRLRLVKPTRELRTYGDQDDQPAEFHDAYYEPVEDVVVGAVAVRSGRVHFLHGLHNRHLCGANLR